MFSGVSKLFANIMIGNIYIYTAEIFPSIFRALGSTLVSMISRVGSLLAPILIPLCTMINIIP